MPLDLRHHAARAIPTGRSIAEAGVIAPDLMWWATDRTLEQMTDAALEHRVGGQSDRRAEALRFQEAVNLGQGEGGVGAEAAPLHRIPVAGNHRLQHRAPAIGAVDGAPHFHHPPRLALGFPRTWERDLEREGRGGCPHGTRQPPWPWVFPERIVGT